MEQSRGHTAGPQEFSELHNLDRPPRPPKVPLDAVQALRTDGDQWDESQSWKKQTFQQKWLGGLRMALRLWVTLSALVLAFNVSCLGWAWHTYKPTNGYGTLQHGDCDTAQNLNRWLHLAINILSTVLLLASAAFMNAAAAPSEDEVRLAHRGASWLQIGLISFRNAHAISMKKIMAVSLLALTSVPVHLVFNSVIFPALAGNDYLWAVTTEGFVSGASFELGYENPYKRDFGSRLNQLANFTDVAARDTPTMSQYIKYYQEIQADVQHYERLDNENCLKEYSKKLVYHHRNLILISSTANSTNSILAWDEAIIDNEGGSDPTDWICSQNTATCDAQPFLANPESWTVFDEPILYCLAEKTSALCSVKYSTSLAITVIVCNVIKLGIEVYVLLWNDLDQAMTCVGDAVAASLAHPDVQLENMSLMDHVQLLPGFLTNPVLLRRPFQYRVRRRRWGAAITRRRWITGIVFLCIAVIFVSLLLIWGVTFVASKGFDHSMQGLWRLGFGNIDPEILIAPDNFGTPVTLSLLANVPQLILAIVYYTYGSMLTAMFTSREYANFAVRAQYLRVSRPLGKQQGTWILSMPFVWGLFFHIIQVLLHWFVSQGFFVVDVSVYNIDGSLNTEFGSISNCGFSPFPIFCAILTATFMMLLVVGLGLRRLPAGCPPIAGLNSAFITAACEPRSAWHERLPYVPLKWGCIEYESNGAGHCSFASDERIPAVQELVEGRWYR